MCEAFASLSHEKMFRPIIRPERLRLKDKRQRKYRSQRKR